MPRAHVPLLIHHRAGGWLPKDHRVLERWLDKKIAKVGTSGRRLRDLSPSVQKFKDVIEKNPVIYMYFDLMFKQVPTKPPYNNDPTGKPQVRNYELMLQLIDLIIREAPEWQDNDLVGFPINAILDWPMGTPAGLAAFAMPVVNECFKGMFDEWTRFLTSYDSTYVLTNEDHGWFGPGASEAMPGFVEMFECNPDDPHYGFMSWDDFFTRKFRPGVRPVELPDNSLVINSACESQVYAIKYCVQATDKFWLKGEPYSLSHMLDDSSRASAFVDGTVYQAFLSAKNYHRWHSPVNGVITDIVHVPGTYYLESPEMGFTNEEGPDPGAPNNSQGFITQTAARAIIYLKADEGKIGDMCIVTVGMAEVSTCEVTVKKGDKVKKGQELGMFHFGGSTHCLIFRPNTPVRFDVSVGQDVLLNQAMAYISEI